MTVRLRVAGGLRMWRSGAEIDISGPRQRVMLATLIAARGNVVPTPEVIDAVWGEQPSPSAVNQLHRLVGQIRRLFEPDLPARAPGRWLHAAGDGYRLSVDPGTCDLIAFLDLAHRARKAALDGDIARAADWYEEGLDIVQEPLFAGLDSSLLERPAFVALFRKRISTAADAAGLAIADPTAVRCVPVLRKIAASAPLDEPLQARLMRLLTLTGRPAQALLLYAETRRELADQLGADPGPELRSAHLEALDGVPDPADPLLTSVTDRVELRDRVSRQL